LACRWNVIPNVILLDRAVDRAAVGRRVVARLDAIHLNNTGQRGQSRPDCGRCCRAPAVAPRDGEVHRPIGGIRQEKRVVAISRLSRPHHGSCLPCTMVRIVPDPLLRHLRSGLVDQGVLTVGETDLTGRRTIQICVETGRKPLQRSR